MDKLKKGNCVTSWSNMPIEDKLLFIMEYVCYLLAIGTLTIFIFAVVRYSFIDAILLFFGAIGFIKCGTSARSTRDSYIFIHKSNIVAEKRILNRVLKEIHHYLF